MTKVFVCTPHGRPLDPRVFQNLLAMQQEALHYEWMYAEVDTIIVGKARNMLVDISTPHDPDVLFFIDDDVLVPPFAHVLIEQALQYGIVGGLYVARAAPYTPQIFEIATQEEYKEANAYWPLLEWPNEMFEVDAIGFGCTAIRADVFARMKEFHTPRFILAAEAVRKALGDKSEIANLVSRLSPWFEFLNSKGEDMYFCERAKEAGQKIYANPAVVCYHLGTVPLGIEHFTYLRNDGQITRDDTGQLVVKGALAQDTYQGEMG